MELPMAFYRGRNVGERAGKVRPLKMKILDSTWWPVGVGRKSRINSLYLHEDLQNWTDDKQSSLFSGHWWNCWVLEELRFKLGTLVSCYFLWSIVMADLRIKETCCNYLCSHVSQEYNYSLLDKPIYDGWTIFGSTWWIWLNLVSGV